jgi:hypothetical protein
LKSLEEEDAPIDVLTSDNARCLDPFSFVVVSLAGWMNQHQLHVIAYLMEENRPLSCRTMKLKASSSQ